MKNIREKPHRLPREAYQGIVTVSFTACIEDRKTPFHEDAIVHEFLELLGACVSKRHCVVLIYCFMPDHLHLVLHGEKASADAWRAMVDFKQKTGYWFAQNQPEFKWQKDFHDHIIRANDDLAAQIRYIADNPVRGGLVAVWSEYPHTGAVGVRLQEILIDVSAL